MSQYGNLKHIVDLETFLGWNLSKIDFTSITTDTINYSWGDETELINWIVLKDKNTKNSGKFYTIQGANKVDLANRKKYPLIWLATPDLEGENTATGVLFRGAKIVIASDTKADYMNSTRWEKDIPSLQAIADTIVGNLKGDLRINKVNNVLQYGYMNRPNYHVFDGNDKENEAKSKTIDFWDAFVLKADLLAKKNCKDTAYLTFCNN